MAFPSVPNTFSSGSVISSSQVNTNFSSLVSGFSDGTKDFSMNNGTLAGTLTVPTISCTTTLKIADGSVSVPSLALSSDADGSGTGLYRKAANSLGFVANGAEVGSFSASGGWTIGVNTAAQIIIGTSLSIQLTQTSNADCDIRNVSANAGAGLTVNAFVPATSTTGDVRYRASIDSGISWTWGLDNSDSDAFVLSRNASLGTNNVCRVDPTVQSFQIKGTNTNDDATAGWVGEEIRSASAATVVISTTNTWQDITSISLTAGDWDVTGLLRFTDPGATITAQAQGVISLNSGNTTTDHVLGDNQLTQRIPTSTEGSSITISEYRISLSSTTTVYLKALISFSAGNPQIDGHRLSARRRR